VRIEIRIDDPNDIDLFLSELEQAAESRRVQIGLIKTDRQLDEARPFIESVRVLDGVAAQIGAQVLVGMGRSVTR
jgi:hypothetical protein